WGHVPKKTPAEPEGTLHHSIPTLWINTELHKPRRDSVPFAGIYLSAWQTKRLIHLLSNKTPITPTLYVWKHPYTNRSRSPSFSGTHHHIDAFRQIQRPQDL